MTTQMCGALLVPFLLLSSVSTGHGQPPQAEPRNKPSTLVEALKAAGFEEVARRVLAQNAKTVVLKTKSTASVQPPGASQIGGNPDLPAGTPWPKSSGKSLSFIAQIKLDEIAAIWPQSPLPRRGTLYFFYDAEQSVWGFDPKDKGKWAVLLSPEGVEKLQRRPFPADLPKDAQFNPKAVTPVLQDSYPEYSQLDLDDLRFAKKDEERLFEIFDAYGQGDATIHRLFGYPDEIQGEMQTECQFASNGVYTGDGTGDKDPRAEKLRAGASSWVLLLQIDSDDGTGMMWGDAGRIYYWIRRQDLAEKAFDKSWLILQCY